MIPIISIVKMSFYYKVFEWDKQSSFENVGHISQYFLIRKIKIDSSTLPVKASCNDRCPLLLELELHFRSTADTDFRYALRTTCRMLISEINIYVLGGQITFRFHLPTYSLYFTSHLKGVDISLQTQAGSRLVKVWCTLFSSDCHDKWHTHSPPSTCLPRV